LFYFFTEEQPNGANAVLQYRLNQHLFESVCLLIQKYDQFALKVQENQGSDVLLYLGYSQFQLYKKLVKDNDHLEHPTAQMAECMFLAIDGKRYEYLISLLWILFKTDLDDSCSLIFEGIHRQIQHPDTLKWLKNNSVGEMSCLVWLGLKTIHLLTLYNQHINLYASIL
jgi:hypothetical protein